MTLLNTFILVPVLALSLKNKYFFFLYGVYNPHIFCKVAEKPTLQATIYG